MSDTGTATAAQNHGAHKGGLRSSRVLFDAVVELLGDPGVDVGNQVAAAFDVSVADVWRHLEAVMLEMFDEPGRRDRAQGAVYLLLANRFVDQAMLCSVVSAGQPLGSEAQAVLSNPVVSAEVLLAVAAKARWSTDGYMEAKLADHPNADEALVTYLVVSGRGAASVLVHRPVLSHEALVALAGSVDPGVRLVVAGRDDVAPALLECLCRDGSLAVRAAAVSNVRTPQRCVSAAVSDLSEEVELAAFRALRSRGCVTLPE